MNAKAHRLNALRLAREHLEGQLDAGIDTRHATAAEARVALTAVENELAELEPTLRDEPSCAHLFRRKRSKR